MSCVLLLCGAAVAAELPLQPLPPSSPEQLRAGARIVLRNCLNCHGARFVHYQDLAALGFDPASLRQQLLPAGREPDAVLSPLLSAEQAQAAFGRLPPDLSSITTALDSQRGSGANFVYTLLRSYVPAPDRPSGWDNRLVPGLAMPNPFPAGTPEDKRYDAEMAEVAAFLQWMAEPGREQRRRLAVPVLSFLLIFAGLAFYYRATIWSKPGSTSRPAAGPAADASG